MFASFVLYCLIFVVNNYIFSIVMTVVNNLCFCFVLFCFVWFSLVFSFYCCLIGIFLCNKLYRYRNIFFSLVGIIFANGKLSYIYLFGYTENLLFDLSGRFFLCCIRKIVVFFMRKISVVALDWMEDLWFDSWCWAEDFWWKFLWKIL